jgi:hypothetical protein
MVEIINNSKIFDEFYHQHFEVLQKIKIKIIKKIRHKRQITYSDIINLIVKENYKNEIYTQIIVWCNYNIRKGNFIIDF